MPRLSLVFLASLFAACVGTREPVVTDDCWTSILRFEGTNNLVFLCKNEHVVRLATFYSNFDQTPTVCRQMGAVDGDFAATFSIQTETGRCENGRTMGASLLNCHRIDSDAFRCTTLQPDFKLIFQREQDSRARPPLSGIEYKPLTPYVTT